MNERRALSQGYYFSLPVFEFKRQGMIQSNATEEEWWNQGSDSNCSSIKEGNKVRWLERKYSVKQQREFS